MSRVAALLSVAALIWAALLTATPAGASSHVAPSASSAKASSHPVDLLWKPDEQDIAPGNPTVLDTFDSFGPPFGKNKPVETKVPRSQVGTDTRSGRWEVTVRPGQDPKRCVGTFEVDRDVIETTQTSQTVKFDGTARIDDCKGLKKFRDLKPGKLGHISGKSYCTKSGCTGGLKIKGTLRY